jgi:hypothetical protein
MFMGDRIPEEIHASNGDLVFIAGISTIATPNYTSVYHSLHLPYTTAIVLKVST